MSIGNSIRAQIPPIHPEGYPFIGGFALASLILFWIWSPLGWIGTVLTVWCALFFRDPVRVTPVREGIVVAPADGRVSMITQVLPPAELGLGDRPLPRVSIFMSVFNCHVNRSPVAGRIDRIAYRPGTFINAELDKASEDNERNSLVISTPNGRIGVIQIAGLVARRIVSFVREGQMIGAGERFGLIRFGSRLDVYLPEGTKRAGRPRARPRWPARPFWPISGSPIPAGPTGPINHRNHRLTACRANGETARAFAIYEVCHADARRSQISRIAPPPVSPDPGAACWCPTSSRCWRSAQD